MILRWHTIFHVWWICVLNMWNRVGQNAFERFKPSWWKFTSAHEDDYHRVQNGPLFTASGEKTHIDSSYPFCFGKVLLVAFEGRVLKRCVEYWAICSFARSFTRTSHSFACSLCSRTPKRYSFTRFAALIQLMGKRFMSLKLMRLFHAISTRSAAVAPLPPSPLYAFPPLITNYSWIPQ